MILVAPDGATVTEILHSAPYVLERCVGAICSPPFTPQHVPFVVGPALGGGFGAGALYAIPGDRTIIVDSESNGKRLRVPVYPDHPPANQQSIPRAD